jgi:Na+/proline symporter
MAVNDKIGIIWLGLGIILFVVGLIGQAILIFIGLLLMSIGLWYWLREPYEPKCRKCGFISRDGAKNCPSCNEKIKKNHTARKMIIGIIVGLLIGFLFVSWIVYTACTNTHNIPDMCYTIWGLFGKSP